MQQKQFFLAFFLLISKKSSIFAPEIGILGAEGVLFRNLNIPFRRTTPVPLWRWRVGSRHIDSGVYALCV